MKQQPHSEQPPNKQLKLIWDLPLRLFHWLFAASIFASWYTVEQDGEMIDLHMKLGYFILGLVIFRLVWGFCGTKHSQFRHFFPTPSKVIGYLKAIKQGEKSDCFGRTQYAGHNPLGSLMVILMIVLIFLQAVSGLFIDDDIFSSGPYYGVLPAQWENVMQYIHHNAFDVMIGAIALHIFVIAYYRIKKKVDLVTPMITGKKSIENIKAKDAIRHSKIVIAIIIAIAVTAFVYWLVVINAPVEEVFYY